MPETSLFLSAFLAGTVLPGSSEAVLLYWLAQGESYWWLIFVATVGNTLGGITAYILGRLGDYGKIERFIGIKEDKAEAFKNRVRPYGAWCAFFGFLPLIGDVIIVALGLINTSATSTIAFMGLGKLIRYIVIASYHQEVEQITRSIFDFLT